MTQVYFHCSSSRGVRTHRFGQAVSDLAEARDRAAYAARKTGANGLCVSATILMTSYSFSPSHSCSARRTEGQVARKAFGLPPLAS